MRPPPSSSMRLMRVVPQLSRVSGRNFQLFLELWDVNLLANDGYFCIHFFHRKIWTFPKIVGFPPKSSNFNRVSHYKPSIWGTSNFWKHPYIYIYIKGWDKSINKNLSALLITHAIHSFLGAQQNSETAAFPERKENSRPRWSQDLVLTTLEDLMMPPGIDVYM